MAVTLAPVSVGAKILAALFNLLFSMLTVAQTYVAVISNWTSATTAPTITSRYWIAGNICHVEVQGKLGTGTITVTDIRLSLPVAMDTTGMITLSTILNGAVGFNDVSATAEYNGEVRYVDANTVQLLRLSQTGAGTVVPTSSSTPMTWATLDELSVSFSYPIG